VSDITYISLTNTHAYLFLVTDKVSQMVVGYHLSRSLSHEGAIYALRNAMLNVKEGSNVIHHTDRGIQYCCHKFLDESRKQGIRLSMTDSDHCAQNALAECMNGILKTEFYLDYKFKNFEQAETAVKEAIFNYNHLRIHGSLNGRTPAEVHFGYDQYFNIWSKELVTSSFDTQLHNYYV